MGCQQSSAIPVPPPPRSLHFIEQMGWVSFRSAFEPSKVLKYDCSRVPHLRLVEEEDSAEVRFRYIFVEKGYKIELEMEPGMVWYVNEFGQVDIQNENLTPPDRLVWQNAMGYLSYGHTFRLYTPHPSPQFWLPYPFDVVVNADGTLTTTHTVSEGTVFETVKIVRGEDGKLIHLDPNTNKPLLINIKDIIVKSELERAAREGREPRPLLQEDFKPLAVGGCNGIDYRKISAEQHQNDSVSVSNRPAEGTVTADMHMAMAFAASEEK